MSSKETVKGKVYLIGAGPGDPGLITVKGMSLLMSADIILYDRLVSDEIKALIPDSVKSICVGGDHGKDPRTKQDNINELMLENAGKGLKVARLKCGDPFLFGRGGEEIEFLTNHGIEYEIVPGISSALGVPTYAGFPLTHRDLSSSILIVSGHRKEQEENDWKKVAAFNGTVIILMGIGRMGEIMKMLIGSSLNSETPVAVIQNGTCRNQKILTGNASSIADLAEREKVTAPGIIIIGEVVKLALLERDGKASEQQLEE